MLDRLSRLPAPQRQALEIVFGLSAGAAPDRFLVGLAVLEPAVGGGRGAAVAVRHRRRAVARSSSALTLAFVARRLLAEPVGLVFAAREPGEALRHVPELEVQGLRDGDARALLARRWRFMLDARVRDRIIAETRGNPLALLELPRGLTATQLAGGFGMLGTQALSGRIEESFVRRARGALRGRAAPVAGRGGRADRRSAAALARGRAARDRGRRPRRRRKRGLLAIGERVTFRHPLVRSAVYRSAAVQERRAVHLALAEATDREPIRTAGRGIWPRPRRDLTSGSPLELERSAGRAQARGGLAAAAAFLQRAVALTAGPARRADRALAAAQASLQAGVFDAALELLATAEVGPLDEFQRARVDLLRAEVAFAASRGSDAPALLLRAAKTLEPLDARSRATPTWTRGARRCSPRAWRPGGGCTRWRAPCGRATGAARRGRRSAAGRLAAVHRWRAAARRSCARR